MSAADRQRQLTKWKESGLSAPGYGRRHGLEARHLYAWGSQSRNHNQTESTEDLFVPVRLSAPTDPVAGLSVTVRHREMEFVVSGADSTGTLISTLRAIRQRCPIYR